MGRREMDLTFRKTGAEETGDLPDEGVRSDESVVLLGKLLDEFLVLVQSKW